VRHNCLTIKSLHLAPRPRLGVPRLDALTLDHIVIPLLERFSSFPFRFRYFALVRHALLTIKSFHLAPRPSLGVPRLDALTLDHIVIPSFGRCSSFSFSFRYFALVRHVF
jgi:hypothetical protein